MSYSIEQLLAFYHAAEGGSFSEAGRRLKKAQSTISFLVDGFETEVGTELFDRSKRSPKLNDRGQAILREVRRVLQAHSNLELRAQNLSVDVEPSVLICLDSGAFDNQSFNQVLKAFSSQFPLTSIGVLDAGHNGPFQMVRSGKADIGIGFSDTSYPEDLDFRGLSARSSITVASSDHPLSLLEAVGPDDLSAHKHIRITSVEAGIRIRDPEISLLPWYADSYSRLMDLVVEGFGWADVPKRLCASQLAEGSIAVLKTKHQIEPYANPVDLVWSKSKPAGPAVLWLIDAISNASSPDL
jgi:DNA-binding transcriptional LysR family regulator